MQYRIYKFAFSHLPVTKPLFRCGQILCPKLLYYDDVTTILERLASAHKHWPGFGCDIPYFIRC